MADQSERMRQLRERLEALQRDNDRADEPGPAVESPVQERRGGRLRSALYFAGFVLAVIVLFQLAFTMTSLSGHDFADAKRVGRATVESCERRGPIGLIYGYWDDCLVSIKWDDGVPQYGRLGKPHLFRADEVGRTVEIGDNGTGRSGRTYSRPTFPPRPFLATVGIILLAVDAIPALFLLWILWRLLRDGVAGLFRRR